MQETQLKVSNTKLELVRVRRFGDAGDHLDAGELWCMGRRGLLGAVRTGINQPSPRRGKKGDRVWVRGLCSSSMG